MKQVILLTGATDGLGRLAADMLAQRGHDLILHGRDQARLNALVSSLSEGKGPQQITGVVGDLSCLEDVKQMAERLCQDHATIDVIINNAGVLKAPNYQTEDDLELRFAVNTIAPFLLTHLLLPKMPIGGRVVNLSSAAQRPVDLARLARYSEMDDMDAYAMSKLAITCWTNAMAKRLPDLVFVSVNPASLLATKMVKEGFGIDGHDPQTGGEVITKAALDDAFATASGRYFDNDSGCFADPHGDALDDEICDAITSSIEQILTEKGYALAQ